MIVSMNSAEKRINKEIAKTVARRSSQGWTADKIAARIWLCYGHLCSVRGNVLSVRMAGGVQNFVISQEVYVTYDELPKKLAGTHQTRIISLKFVRLKRF